MTIQSCSGAEKEAYNCPSKLRVSQYPHSYVVTILALGNWHKFMIVAVSNICDLIDGFQKQSQLGTQLQVVDIWWHA